MWSIAEEEDAEMPMMRLYATEDAIEYIVSFKIWITDVQIELARR